MKDNQLKKAQEFARKQILEECFKVNKDRRKTKITFEKIVHTFFKKGIRLGNRVHPIELTHGLGYANFFWYYKKTRDGFTWRGVRFQDQPQQTQISIAKLLGYKTGGEDEKTK